jgi:predicted dehydrogenase
MKVGVVGYGSIGKRHADNFVGHGHTVLVYDPALRRDVGRETQLYEQCDAVVVATPSPYHEGALRAAVERGKHVLIEKPISTAIGGLPLILSSALAQDLVVMMGNNLRFHPGVQQAKQWIGDGKIGLPLWANFICASKSTKPLIISDGVILNTGSHEVDVALHLLGPAKVLTATARRMDGTDDIADFVLLHDNGCRSSFHINFVTPDEVRGIWIGGTEDVIGIGTRNRSVSLGSKRNVMPGNFDSDYRAEAKAFVDRIEGKEVPGATGGDGLATLLILLEVRKMAGLP